MGMILRADWRTDKIVEACIILEDEFPRAKRALVAARRSGRDRMFNAHIGWRRIQLVTAKPAMRALDWMASHGNG